MFKKTIALCLIYTIFLFAASPTQISGQIQNKTSNEPPVKIEKELAKPPKLNVKKAFEKEFSSSKFEIENARVDFGKIEKEQYKQPQNKGKTSTKTKLLWVAIIAGIVVGAVLLWKYENLPKCDEVSCYPGDPDCFCEY